MKNQNVVEKTHLPSRQTVYLLLHHQRYLHDNGNPKMRMGYKQRNDDLACMYFSLTNVLTNNVIRDLTTCSHLV